MAYTTIKKPSDYFNTKLYTGNGSTQSITGVGFQPDWTWIKNRSIATGHRVTDAVRGNTKVIYTNATQTEETVTNMLTSFDSNGFSVGSDGGTNGSGNNIVSWNWKANGAGSANTDGSITSTVSANTTSGFSIVSYTGGGSFGDTVGHGLGAVPAMIIVKTTNATSSWYIWQKAMGATDNQFIDFSTGALQTSGATIFDVSAMSSTTFTLGANTDVNGSGSPKIAYCFAEKQGFSKFGSWTGADGAFIYTGFKPAFILGKNASNTAGYDWWIFDNKRDSFNDGANNLLLRPNASDTEQTITFAPIDFLSNGFKIYGTDNTVNGSGETMIYMAFAEEPLVGDNPATAR